ncbi:MAG: bifunctional 3-deoxy-7-phosphoheptulonate synthase/chorismate mutase type II [Chitinophagales bacterium]|nr:bifunctional 3-deoxy-7-phosphoheptulonate synthase/chorismate mutase type II [Chitinophagales bacterium]
MASKFQISPIQTWLPAAEAPVVIAGPCSAEGEEQVMLSAHLIAKHAAGRVHLLRAGIWKPRTRPNTFEGVGEIGLPWLKNAGNEVGMPVTVEVANPEHVEAALRHGIDVLWIGARTTVSPFAVQEIAEALRGVDVPVLVKNPINPDLELWIGALERLHGAGIRKLGVIHRGFSSYEKSVYRNPPMWEIPIELRRRFPEIPILVDPSHMGGKRHLIATLAQQGLDMGFDGLMIETHPHPDKAWSDAAQQITPQRLAEILQGLIVRKPTLPENSSLQALHDLRARVDRIDDYIIELLAERMGISEQIGKVKKEHQLAIHQKERWAQIVARALQKGKTGGLTEEFILKLFQQIHNESIRHQTKVVAGEEVATNGQIFFP